MRLRITGTTIALLLATMASGNAQVPPPPQSPPRPAQPAVQQPPPPGFVSSYEIMQTLRSAGFDPLAPPLREGTVYVARATDYRGILMRVVLDARTGAIRDANRIVPGPGNYEGPYGGTYGSEPYGSGPYSSGPYGPEPNGPGPYGRVGMMPPPDAQPRESDNSLKPVAPNLTRPASGVTAPPLPRPRPPRLASRKPVDDAKPSAGVDPKPGSKADSKPDITMTAPATPTAAAAQAAPLAPAPAPAPAIPRTAPSTLSINN